MQERGLPNLTCAEGAQGQAFCEPRVLQVAKARTACMWPGPKDRSIDCNLSSWQHSFSDHKPLRCARQSSPPACSLQFVEQHEPSSRPLCERFALVFRRAALIPQPLLLAGSPAVSSTPCSHLTFSLSALNFCRTMLASSQDPRLCTPGRELISTGGRAHAEGVTLVLAARSFLRSFTCQAGHEARGLPWSLECLH